MRILVVGAGGIGGYFGGRLAEKGEDVVFLVRPKRKEQLEKKGLVIHSVNGDFSFAPKLIMKDDRVEPFDIVLLSTKAYHLIEAINDVKAFVGEKTVIIPLLNGMAHLTPLKEAFGDRVIGGLCIIETTLNQAGEVEQSSPFDQLLFGEFDQTASDRVKQIAQTFSGTKADFVFSDHITRDMWHKYLLITVLSGVTTLMRAPIGPIVESDGGREFIQSLLMETAEIMRASKAPIADDIVDKHMKTILSLSYDFKTSMQRDMAKRLSIEGEHLQGYLLNIAKQHDIKAPYLQAVYQNLNVYEKML